MKAIQLTITERIALLNMMPAEGTSNFLVFCKQLRSILEINAADSLKYGLRRIGNDITWRPEYNGKVLEIELTEQAHAIMNGWLKQLNNSGRLPDALCDIYYEITGEETPVFFTTNSSKDIPASAH